MSQKHGQGNENRGNSREEWEARIVAWLLGEADEAERELVRRAIARDASLAAYSERMKQGIRLARQAHAENNDAAAGVEAPEQARLSEDRRRRLTALWTDAGQGTAEPDRRYGWRSGLALAAGLMVLAGGAAVSLKIFFDGETELAGETGESPPEAAERADLREEFDDAPARFRGEMRPERYDPRRETDRLPEAESRPGPEESPARTLRERPALSPADEDVSESPLVVDADAKRHALQAGDREAAESLKAKLADIVLPSVHFHEVSLGQVLETLQEISAGYDPEGVGVSLVLLDPDGKNPSVSVVHRNASLDEILADLAETAGFEVEVRDSAVVLRPEGYEEPVPDKAPEGVEPEAESEPEEPEGDSSN